MNHHGILPVMTVIRNGKTVRINVTDYDESTDTIPGADPVESSESVNIPVDWHKLSWPQLRSLASKVNPTPINGRNDAIAAINRYLQQ